MNLIMEMNKKINAFLPELPVLLTGAKAHGSPLGSGLRVSEH